MSSDECPSRAELADAVQELRRENKMLQSRVDALVDAQDRLISVVVGDDHDFDDEFAENHPALLDLVTGEDPSAGPSAEVRKHFLPLHEFVVDIQTGSADRIPGEKEFRAAEIFRRIVRKLCGDPQPGVSVGRDKVIVSSGDAKDMIAEADDGIEDVQSNTVRRAFVTAQSTTKTEDCDCETIDACDHGLLVFRPGGTNRLVADRQRLETYLANVETWVDGAETVGEDGPATADDPEDPGEDAVGVEDTFDELDEAQPARADGGSR